MLDTGHDSSYIGKNRLGKGEDKHRTMDALSPSSDVTYYFTLDIVVLRRTTAKHGRRKASIGPVEVAALDGRVGGRELSWRH